MVTHVAFFLVTLETVVIPRGHKPCLDIRHLNDQCGAAFWPVNSMFWLLSHPSGVVSVYIQKGRNEKKKKAREYLKGVILIAKYFIHRGQ